MDYNTPFAGLPDANVPNNPFWSGVQEQRRADIMQPFLGMHQQRQQLDLQDAQLKSQEFASPEAREARLLGHKATSAKHTFDAAKAAADFQTLPQETKLKTLKLANEMQSEQGKPYAQMFESLASLSDQLEKMPEEHRPLLYKQWADRYQLTSGRPLPDSMKNYRPEILDDAKMVKFALVNTPHYAQQRGLKELEGTQAMDRQREQSRSAATVANINASAAMNRQTQAQQAARVNIPQRIVQLKRQLADPSLGEEERSIAREELSGYVMESFAKTANNNPLLKSLSGMAAIPGQTGEQATARYNQIYQDLLTKHMAEYGLATPARPQQGTDSPTPGVVEALKASGELYEPDKFDYRVGPDGRIQKRPKQK